MELSDLLSEDDLLSFTTSDSELNSTHSSTPVSAPAHTAAAPSSAAPSQRFAAPISDEEIETRRRAAVPKSTHNDTQYCIRVWAQWQNNRIETTNSTIPSLSSINPDELEYWLTRFVLEVRKQDHTEYPPATIHHLCSGIQRHLRANHLPQLDIYSDALFANFRSTLDAEMKRLQQQGLGSKKKKAEPLTDKEEDILWSKGILGDHTPQALLNTMVYCNGIYFALRSGKEHRELRFSSCQIEVVQKEGQRPYLLYTEDQSKNHPGGLMGRKIPPKVVKHHSNVENQSRCFVRLFTLYKSLCPSNPKRNSFYLQPLRKPTQQLWFSREPLGHNKLSHMVSKMCSDAGIEGFHTNHSLRATSATRLFSAGADEQLITECTGHRSVDGVRSYKRTSEEQQQGISDILSLSKRPRTLSSPTPADTQPTAVSPLPSRVQPTLLRAPTADHVQLANEAANPCKMPGTFYFHSCNSVVIHMNK